MRTRHFVSCEDRSERDQRERKGSRKDLCATYRSRGPSDRRGVTDSECSQQYDQRGPIREGIINSTISIKKVHVELLLLTVTTQERMREVNLLQKLCNDPARFTWRIGVIVERNAGLRMDQTERVLRIQQVLRERPVVSRRIVP
jgi:hypothetical protein